MRPQREAVVCKARGTSGEASSNSSFIAIPPSGTRALSVCLFELAALSWLLLSGLLRVQRAGATSEVQWALLAAVACLVAERGLSSCDTGAQLPHGRWGLPRPGIKPESSALEGGFLTTGPPGMSPESAV